MSREKMELEAIEYINHSFIRNDLKRYEFIEGVTALFHVRLITFEQANYLISASSAFSYS